jgi:endonuclease/exonuclease/phosphatase family metal-dependent hydrolase
MLSGRAMLELQLVTMNLWGLPWPVARDRRDRKRRFLEQVVRGPYDLVGIQELWWPWRRSLRRTPLVLPRSRRDSGLGLAGRLALRDAARIEHFRDHAGPDRLKRKGLLRATVAPHPEVQLCTVVTHLQAGRRHARARARQIEQLLDAVSKERRPVVMMGDFNLYRDEVDDRHSAGRLDAAGFVDVAVAVSRPESTYVSSNPYVRRRRCSERFDRIYLRSGGGVRLVPLESEVLRFRPRPLSDHHPLRVRLAVRDRE